ncbi:MAG TPA: hypothetical protein VGC85_10055 [Chthoniobacterales bacterium]|jgi:hypothetical protein
MNNINTSLRRATFGFASFASYLLFAASNQAGVVPNDTFNTAIIGANAANQAGFLAGPFTPTFGTTLTVANGGLAGQTATITSSETNIAGFTTDSITISVPTNFDPAGTTIGGTAVTQMFMFIASLAGANTLDFTNPVTSAVFTGSVIYAGGTLALVPTVTFTNGGLSVSMNEGVQAGGSDLAPFAIRSFTFNARYATPVAAPDAGGTLLLLVSSVGLLVLVRRRFAAA